MATAPFLRGEQSTCKLFIGPELVDALDVKSWKVQPDVTKINDGICGEDRDRLDRVVNFFTITLTCHNVNAKKLKKLLTDQANDDAGVQPTDKTFGLIVKPRDGSKDGFVAKECTIDDWSWDGSGRGERVMLEIPVRARYFDVVSI